MQEIAKAIISVMKEIKGIEKNKTVGVGASSYKGVADKDVKLIIGAAMEKNGLCILPIDIQSNCKVERWEETGQNGSKMKQQVFTEVQTKYLLLHESGQSIELSGIGHGIDSQDKSAGKATTYALKNALLYAFMVPTGDIDDTDKHHSDEMEVVRTQPAPQKKQQSYQNKVASDLILKELFDCKSSREVVELYGKYKETVSNSDALKTEFKMVSDNFKNQSIK